MLAQNFNTAVDLDITDAELDALIKVLGMLERGELVNADPDAKIPNGFNMGEHGREGCGTVACIGGWCASIMGVPMFGYVESHIEKGRPLHELYWDRISSDITPQQAALALRSYLTTGEANWAEALASP
jgi:hypothetical protein